MNVISLPKSTARTGLKCANCPVRDVALCAHASTEALRDMHRLTRYVTARRGQSIMMQGDDADTVGVLVQGVVKIVFITEDGETQVPGLLFPGNFVGRAFESTMQVSYEAATDASLCMISRRSFENLLDRSRSLEHGYLVSTLEQMDMMRNWTCLLRGRTSEQRVATYLAYRIHADKAADVVADESGEKTVLELLLSRSDLSSVLDMTPETFCRCLHGLAGKGAIAVLKPNVIEVTSAELLLDLAGAPLDGITECLSTCTA